MYLKTDKIIARIGDITMRSYKTGIGNEYILDPTAMEGWLDSTAVRRSSSQRLGTHGDFQEPFTFGSRLITFSGTAIAISRGNLRYMRDDLIGAVADGRYQTLAVSTMSSERYAKVSLEGTVSWVRQSDTVASFRITFYAPDPFLYGGWKNVQSGAVQTNRGGLAYNLSYPLNYNLIAPNTAQTVKNNGNAPSWPIFIVTGDFYSGFALIDNNQHKVEYTGAVTVDSPVTIDMSKGTATQNGSDRTISVRTREWFSIPPGQTLQPEIIPATDANGDQGAGWCDILYRDTWI